MIWYILIALFLLLVTWLLVGPVILITDTVSQRYLFTVPGIVKASVVPADELFLIRIWIFFIPVTFDPFRPGKRTKRKKTRKRATTPGKNKKKSRARGAFRMIPGFLKAIRVKKLDLDLDTDDFMLNAWLVPAFSAINRENIRMRVNFEGRMSVVAEVRTRIGALMWVFIKYRTKSIFNL